MSPADLVLDEALRVVDNATQAALIGATADQLRAQADLLDEIGAKMQALADQKTFIAAELRRTADHLEV